MNATANQNTVPDFSANQRAALLTLLTDEDPAVYEPVRARILSGGPAVGEWLQPHALSPEPLLRQRVREILDYFARHAADERFLAFCLKHCGAQFDLEQAVWLLAQTQFPDANDEAYAALLDGYAATLRERLVPGQPPRETLGVINRFLFGELGFRGDERNYYHPDNSYLNRVLDRRRGNPISLCLVYLFLARRLKLPVVGIGLPGHFLCRFQNSSAEIYIDAFHGGRFLTKNDCIHHLIRTGQPFDSESLNPASPRRILARICANLLQSCQRYDLGDDAARLQRYVIALAQ